jgi:hypothetical protein
MKGNLSVTKPFNGSNRRCFNGQRFAIALHLQKVADFLHLLGSISVEFVTGVSAVLTVVHHESLSIPQNRINRAESLPRRFPIEPVLSVTQKEIVLALEETHCFVVSQFCLENGRDVVNK